LNGNDNGNNYNLENQKISNVEMAKEVKKAFIEYSMSVIVARALPDVRDGLKPGQRRIIYAMYEDRLTADKPFRKSATTVGNVLGRYHPHGDASVYDTMVRMAQPFALRYPLIEGHGNFGNIDGDEAAAYRYTEARLSKLADEMTVDLDKNVVAFMPNFDNKLKEPVVLPSRFPNLIVNGSIGIAVGMATNIPPHNLGEVVDGICRVIDDPDASLADVMKYIKGPDFPTRATICGTSGIYEAYQTGRGKITVKARAEIEEEKRRIIISEIPYQVNKTSLVEAMADCVKDKRIDGITDIRDESGMAGLRIVVEFRRDANSAVILNQLYKFTQLRDTFAVNIVVLVNNEPKTLGLMELIRNYIAHQVHVIENRLRYELEKAIHEAHINEGYKIAIDNIDRVIEIIRGSASIPDAKEKLTAEFNLTDIQATAIVEMTLGRLTGLERQKVEERLAKLYATIAELQATLADKTKINEIIKTDLLEIKRKFGDDRRTEIIQDDDDIANEDLIDRHTCFITLTDAGYIKRLPSSSYSAQRRGGKGIIGMATKEEDNVTNAIAADTHAYFTMFTNKGRLYTRKGYQIPEGSRTAKGTNIANILELDAGEKITALISTADFSDDNYLIMVTKRGGVKRSSLALFKPTYQGGKIAMNLEGDDELVYAGVSKGGSDVMIVSRDGQAVRFHEDAVAERLGRKTRAVRAIRLDEGDEVVGAAVVNDGETLLVITENGYGKRLELDDFTPHGRGGHGVKCQKVTDKTGGVIGIASVVDSDDIMLMTDGGTVIRTPVAGISVVGRNAQGVIIMRTNGTAKIVNFVKVGKDDETVPEEETESDGDNEIDNSVDNGIGEEEI
jgi:DNA gyrase subunit A